MNADDPWGRRLLERPSIPVTTYALDGAADLRASEVQVGHEGVSLVVDGVRVDSALRGRFNAANCLGVFAVGRVLGIPDDRLAAGIGSIATVPGRMEPVDAGQPFAVVVDYAHTPDSILGVLRGARALADGQVIVVFGCGGDRDRAKRPMMGRAASEHADLTIVTSDNPRHEDPAEIIAEVVAGILPGASYRVEIDRRAAIHDAVVSARPGDIVVIAGKGHETTQSVGDETVPFDDREVARAAIAEAIA